MYAIVDIETTGGNAKYHDITEIAICILREGKIVDEYTTLIDPEQRIPPFITSLTGIDNEMVRDAPTFQEVADKIDSLLSNNIFVAHNVNFDYSFLKMKFSELGRTFQMKKLCTVRLSRKLIKGVAKYSLGNLCTHLNIPNEARHRAYGDAKATVQLFKELLKRDKNNSVISTALNPKKSFLLPPNVPQSTFNRLPSAIGVYYFHDNKGNVIYVGKAKDIRHRVRTHFSGNTHSKTKTLFRTKIHDVTFEKTGSELLAYLLEDQMIKKHYPYFNRTNKKFILNQGLYKYYDQEGYIRLAIGPVGKYHRPIQSFASQSEALQYVLSKCLHEGLCMKRSGILKNRNCNYVSSSGKSCPICQGNISIEDYNERVTQAIKDGGKQKTYLIQTIGRNLDELGIVMIENGKVLGIGYIEKNLAPINWDEAKESLTTHYDTRDAQAIVSQHLKKAHLIAESPYSIYAI